MLQIGNLKNANSKHNTCLLILAECKDTPDNLRRLLDPYRDQIEQMKTRTWRDKHFRLFLFGDYDCLVKPYGQSGAQGVHPCLYCTASKSQIQTPKRFNEGNITQRTLLQMQADYKKFRRTGKKKQKAKMYNNVIRKYVMNIDLDHVCPPYLHILLGVVKKHHDLLEKVDK